jgi:hypothetical protein
MPITKHIAASAKKKPLVSGVDIKGPKPKTNNPIPAGIAA